MIKIIFESHNTSYDNEKKQASGWNDVELSPLGMEQSKELFTRNKDKDISTIYCSDLQRSYMSARLFKDGNITIIKDPRLREWDYGDMTQKSTKIVNPDKINRIEQPFPNGENAHDWADRIDLFLKDIKDKHKDGDVILIIGHRATQYGLNHALLGHSLEKCVSDKWSWQPGWEYQIEK
jgi:broad specificity phosphatase PhoE